jgi:hypothetical protein
MIGDDMLYNPAAGFCASLFYIACPEILVGLNAPDWNSLDFSDLADDWLVADRSATSNDAREDCTRHDGHFTAR